MMLYQYMNVDTFLKAFTPEGFWVKASYPCEFDDPYECTGLITGEPSPAAIDQFFTWRPDILTLWTELQYCPGLEPWECRTKSDCVRNWLVKSLREREFLSRGYRISCFCADGHDEDLMWAFYGNKSKGVRLVFDLEGLDIPLVDVQYLSEPPSVNLDGMDDLQSGLKPFFDSCVASKHNSWEYQKEVRAIFQGPDDSRVSYSDEMKIHRWLIPIDNIRSIDLGCEVMPNFKDRGAIARKIRECGERFYLVRSTVRLYNKYGFSKKNEEIEMAMSACHLSRSIQIR